MYREFRRHVSIRIYIDRTYLWIIAQFLYVYKSLEEINLSI